MKIIYATYTILKSFEVEDNITIEEANEIVEFNAPGDVSDIEWEFNEYVE